MTEVKLRRWLKKQHPNALWVEAASGSSFGVPDAYLMGVGGGAFWLELKQGRVVGGDVLFGVRPAQRQVMRMLGRAGICAGFLVALAGSDDALFLVPEEAAMDGRVGLVQGLPRHGCCFDLKRADDNQSVLERVSSCWQLWKKVVF